MLLFRLLVLAALWLCWSGSLLAQTFTTLYIFGAGGSPRGTLVEGKDGNLYGRTYGYGGRNNGMIFKITSTGTLTTVYNLNPQNGDGAVPAGLVQHSNGIFYGPTIRGGKIVYHFCPGCCGTLFSLSVP